MKKSLLATTALAALGAVAVAGPATAAEKIKVSVGGYMEQWFGYSDNKNSVNADRLAFDQQSDGEIHFKGSTTLDNGIKSRRQRPARKPDQLVTKLMSSSHL